MGLFGKKVDYDELYRKLSTEKMTGRELKKAEKLLDKLEYSGDRRGILWRPLISIQWKCADNASYYFSKAESKLGLCEEYIHIRSLPIVVNLLIEEYEYTPKPGDVIFSDVYRPHLRVVVFVARAYEHGWGVEKNHEKAVEIIRETESYPKDGTFSVNSDLIKNAYKEITGKEFPDSESSEQKEKQAISDAAKNQNEQPQSDINFKRVEYDGGDVYEGEILNGKRHGHGTYTWADGDTYEGDWRDGKRCGRGKLIQYGKSPSGETYMKYSYDGEWLDSKEHGHGICVEGDFSWFKNDKVLEGEWVNGKRQGRFVWYLTNSKGGRYMDFYEDGNLIETCIPYDESIKTVEDARRARALADGKGRSSAVARTTTTPAAAPSNLSADGLLSRYNSTFILDFVSENPAIFRADYDNENLNRAVNALKKGDGLHFLFYVKRSKSLSMLNICCMELYPILLKMYRIDTEDIYNNLVRRLVYKNNLADLSCEDAEYCLYLFDAFIPHGRDYEAMARCYYRLGDVKSAARWVAEGPLYDEIMAFRHLQKAQNVWERGRYAFNEDSKSSFADIADDRLVIAEKCLSRAQKSGHSYRLGEIQEQASILRSELQPYLW